MLRTPRDDVLALGVDEEVAADGSGAPVTSSRLKATPEPLSSPLLPKTICCTLTAVPQSSGMRLMRR